MTLVRTTFAALFAGLLLACEATKPLVPYNVAATSGDAQTDTVARVLPVPLVVTVLGEGGNPASGVPVMWTVQSGGGSVGATTVTDAAGQASATWTLGPIAGAQTVRAGAGGGSVTFTATALPDAPTQASKNAGDRQNGAPSAPLPVPYVVLVRDQFGNPAPGVTVNWVAAAGQGSVSAGTGVTSAAGVATTVHTLGPNFGVDSVTASVPVLGATLTFTSTALREAVLVATVPIPANYGIHDTFVRDGIAFVFAWNSGVMIYDVGNGINGGSPNSPKPISTLVTNASGIAAGADVHNGWWFWNPSTGEKKYLFIGQEGPAFGGIGFGSSGLIHVVDVHDLAHPVEVAYFHKAGPDSTGTHNFWMDETNQILYAAYYNGGVIALDVSGTLTGDLSSRLIDSLRIGGPGDTYTWGVQLYNGSVYAVDMLSGLWQLNTANGDLSFAAGGNNVPERFGSDLWVANGYAYTGTWGGFFRTANVPGNAVKVWQLGATGAPTLVDSIITTGIGTVSDVEVSSNGKLLMFSAENGPNAGFHFYSLADPAHPTFLSRYLISAGVHTATLGYIGGRVYAFGAKDPGSPALVILDVTSLTQ